MTIDEAIKHCLEVAEQNETSAITYKNCKEIKTNMYEKLTAEKAENDCRECAADHRQLAEWLTELKEAKRLLKLAVEDIYNARRGINCEICDMPKNNIETEKRCEVDNVQPECKYRWRHADEALKLIES